MLALKEKNRFINTINLKYYEMKVRNKKMILKEKNIKLLIIVQSLNFLILNMGNVFISIFLINTSNDVMGALLYNLFIAIMILVGFL